MRLSRKAGRGKRGVMFRKKKKDVYGENEEKKSDVFLGAVEVSTLNKLD